MRGSTSNAAMSHVVFLRVLLCLLLCAALPIAARTPADFSLYHTAEQLLSLAAAIKEHNPHYVSTVSCPALPELPVYTLTSPHSHSHIGTDKLRLLLNFGEHGRELITSEVALTLLRFIDGRSRQKEREQKEQSERPATPADSSADYEYERYIDQTDNDLSDAYLAFLLRNTHTTVVPLINVWGRQRVEAGDVCSRKNRNGVDLNRNFDFLHSHNTQQPYDETYAGTAPFTEVETQCLAQLASPPFPPPTVYANVHSGIQELYFGWDHTATPQLPNQREVTRMYERVNSYHCSCKVGAAGKIAGYVVYGGSMDWMYAARNVSYSLTYEVYGDETANNGDCYRTFNPQTRDDLQDTCYRFATSFFTVMQYLIEEKFGVQFPYRPPSFSLVQLYMTEDAKSRNAVKVYYHTWQQLKQWFSTSTRNEQGAQTSTTAVDASMAASSGLPAFDPHRLLLAAHGGSNTSPSPTTVLHVLLIAQNQSNAFFPTELLYHLSHQLITEPYRRIELVILPTLFPVSRRLDQLCTAGMTDDERAAVARELYEAEEEVERVSRLIRPHVVIEVTMGGREGETEEEVEKQHRRRRDDQFDILFHNDSASDDRFVSSALSSLAAIHPPLPFTSPLSLSTHLHLRLVYRGFTPPPRDKHEARRRASDRYPPDHYLTPTSSTTTVRCDWDDWNVPPTELVDHLTPALHSLHTILTRLADMDGRWADVAVREETDESDRRPGFFADDGLGVRMSAGSDEWMPSVWKQGAGWRGWLLLFGLIALLVAGTVLGSIWIRAHTRTMKAAIAV